MKKLLLLILMVVPLLLMGAPVDKKTARKVAINFYSSVMNVEAVDTSQVSCLVWESTGVPVFYIHNFQSGGWVITSADDCIIPVIGYSTEGSFQLDGLNDAAKMFIGNLGLRVKANLDTDRPDEETIKLWQMGQEKSCFTVGQIVPPFIKQQWDQGCYYNSSCPTSTVASSCHHVWAGCGAIPIAVILKYYDWPSHGNGYRRYKTQKYGYLESDFSTRNYDYSKMPDKLSGENKDVADLIYDVGVSMDMLYSETGSISYLYDLYFSLKNSFGFNDYISLLSGYELSSSNKLRNELDSLRPILYYGNNGSAGHFWLMDGYDGGNNMYHMNWCWGGDANGFFKLNNLKPNGLYLGDDQYAIIGIYPVDEEMFFERQNAGYQNTYMLTYGFSPVSNDVCWAIGRSALGSGNSNYITVTSDGGHAWTTRKVINTAKYSIGSLSAVSDSTAFITKYSLVGNQDENCGVYKTTDKGATWEALGVLSGAQSFANNVYFWDESVGVAMGDGRNGYFEIYRTEDGGATWVSIPSANIGNGIGLLLNETGCIDRCSATKEGIIGFTTSKGRVFISSDKGLNWKVITVLSNKTPLSNIAIKSIDQFAVTDFSNDLHFTIDGGKTFTLSTQSSSTNIYSGKIISIPGTNTYLLTEGGTTNFTRGNSLYFTTDDGKTFNTINRVNELATYGGEFISDSVGWIGTISGYYEDLPENDGILRWNGHLARTSQSLMIQPNSISLELPLNTLDTVSIRVKNRDFSKQNWSISLSGGGSWVDVPVSSFTLDIDGETYVQLVFNTNGLPEGTYNATLSFYKSLQKQEVPIKLKVGSIGIADKQRTPFVILPNPAIDHFIVKASVPISGLKLLNLTGAIVKEFTIHSNGDYSVHGIASGVYLLEITSPSGVFYSKLIVSGRD